MDEFEPLPTPVLHSLTADDGWLLRVWDFTPEPRQAPLAVAIVGHAMMVDSRTICRPDRPTLASVLVAAGFRVLVPDLRGHGESGPLAAQGGDWTTDQLIADVGHYVALARSLEPELPISLVGHSLFGHASLAWLATRDEDDAQGREIEAVVALACDVWNRRFEPSPLRWVIKAALFWLSRLVVEAVGYLPARRLRLGSADEPRSYWRQFHTWIRTNRWCSVDGGVDYHAGLGRLQVPFLHMLSEGDRLYGCPQSALRMSATVPEREVVVLGRDDAPGELARMRPNHMGTITDVRSKLAWHWIAGWLLRKLGY